MPTRLTGTALFTQRPKAFRERAKTNGTSCSRQVSMMVCRASSKPPKARDIFPWMPGLWLLETVASWTCCITFEIFYTQSSDLVFYTGLPPLDWMRSQLGEMMTHLSFLSLRCFWTSRRPITSRLFMRAFMGSFWYRRSWKRTSSFSRVVTHSSTSLLSIWVQ